MAKLASTFGVICVTVTTLFLLHILSLLVSPTTQWNPALHVRTTPTETGLTGVSFNTTHSLVTNQATGTCAPGSPCTNGACCSSTGFCGYGPSYCGSTCISNCNAVAECGQYASPSGLQCPLNVCCSQYGFCGTTEDFCTTGCQSHCTLNPSVPASDGIVEDGVLSRVIGYYESWNADLSCHMVKPDDLPLDALTHINFAFAYLDSSFNVVTMGGPSDASLMTALTNIKSIKPDIKVFISIGGWSFTDNGTSTQPLFREIASSASNRQNFANILVAFMRQYAFDGVDIDWEYPGAPDRGGEETDGVNYALLVQTLRSTFDASGSRFGLTFTAPSSYWYLRWFDLPAMIPYVDWINWMTYDLHGIWDSTDPIGSIVQAHTNLTEIQLAAQLFWRVNVPPNKITMGFGFYGRAFTLENPSCTIPGCPFSGAAVPGPCTKTAGILAYYEIMSVLASPDPPTAVWDHAAAVKYISWAGNQWVSYDDADTFAQKTAWANSVGIGGSMIWASDQDDAKYTAHAGLLGRAVQSNSALENDKVSANPIAIAQVFADETGQNCFRYTGKCVNLDDNAAMAAACGAGNTVVGWDDAGCGTKKCHCGKPICCPNASAPKDCVWRGDKNGGDNIYDCSGQCFPGEINIQGIKSSWGGGFTNDGNTNKCGRGYKTFCCPDPNFESATEGCAFGGCSGTCPTGTSMMFQHENWAHKPYCGFSRYYKLAYCCPDPSPLSDCQWISGTAGYDCANAVCPPNQVEVYRDSVGASGLGCVWRRMQVVCCTINVAAVPEVPPTCSVDLCTYFEGSCSDDPDNDEEADGYTKRDIGSLFRWPESPAELWKRGSGPQQYVAELVGTTLTVYAAIYPSSGQMEVNAASYYAMPAGLCTGIAIALINGAPTIATDAEHVLDRQIIKYFLESAASGVLASGATSAYKFTSDFLTGNWNLNRPATIGTLPAVAGVVGSSINTRVFNQMGSFTNPEVLWKVQSMVNGAKGRMFALRPAYSFPRIRSKALIFINSPSQRSQDVLLQMIRVGYAVFDYLNDPPVAESFTLVCTSIAAQLYSIGKLPSSPAAAADLSSFWIEFMTDYAGQIELKAQTWAASAIVQTIDAINAANTAGVTADAAALYASTVAVLNTLNGQTLTRMKLPPLFYSIPRPGNSGSGIGSGNAVSSAEDLVPIHVLNNISATLQRREPDADVAELIESLLAQMLDE